MKKELEVYQSALVFECYITSLPSFLSSSCSRDITSLFSLFSPSLTRTLSLSLSAFFNLSRYTSLFFDQTHQSFPNLLVKHIFVGKSVCMCVYPLACRCVCVLWVLGVCDHPRTTWFLLFVVDVILLSLIPCKQMIEKMCMLVLFV